MCSLSTLTSEGLRFCRLDAENMINKQITDVACPELAYSWCGRDRKCTRKITIQSEEACRSCEHREDHLPRFRLQGNDWLPVEWLKRSSLGNPEGSGAENSAGEHELGEV